MIDRFGVPAHVSSPISNKVWANVNKTKFICISCKWKWRHFQNFHSKKKRSYRPSKHIFLYTDSASRRERCCQSLVRDEASRMAKAYAEGLHAGGRRTEGGREGIAG